MDRTQIVVVALTAIAASVSAQAPLDVHAILERSVAANQAAWKAAPEYTFDESDRDADGTKTYEVTMLLGSPYSRLTQVNGQPLTEPEQQQQERKYQAELAKRRAESVAARQHRIAAYQQERERDHALLEQVTEAFDFTVVGREQRASRSAYHLHATPRPGYEPPNLHARALVAMAGDLWIDAATYNWISVTAEVQHPVTLAGFVARIEPGTYFELEYMPVPGGVWLPRHFVMRARSAILGVFHHGSHEDTTYFNYKRTSTRSTAAWPVWPLRATADRDIRRAPAPG
jgi:hypothetical protein